MHAGDGQHSPGWRNEVELRIGGRENARSHNSPVAGLHVYDPKRCLIKTLKTSQDAVYRGSRRLPRGWRSRDAETARLRLGPPRNSSRARVCQQLRVLNHQLLIHTFKI